MTAGGATGGDGTPAAGRVARTRGHLAAVFSPELYTGPVAAVWVQAALILACALIFGFQYVAFKSVFHAVGPWTLLTLRALLTIPVLLTAMRWTRVPVATGRAELLRIALPAAFLLGSQATFMLGVHRLSAGLTSTLFSVSPIVTLALGLVFRVERVGLLGLIGSTAGVAGVAIATGALDSSVDAVGVLLVLASNVLYSLSFIAIKRMATRVSSAIFLIVAMVESVVVLGPVAGATEGFSMHWGWKSLLSLVYIVVIGQAVAYIGVMALLRFGGVFQSMLVTPLIPVFAIFFAVVLLGEPLLGRELAGGALIIGGVLLAITPRSALARLNPAARRGSIAP